MRSYWYGKLLHPLYHALKRDGVNDAIRQLAANQRKSSQALLELQRTKLHSLIAAAARDVPFYRSLLESKGFSARPSDAAEMFSAIPPLTKEAIRHNLDALTSRRTNVADLIMNSTSGSTGEPLAFYTDARSLAMRKASVIRNASWTGWRLGDREAWLWGAPIELRAAAQLRGRIHSLVTGQLLLNAADLSDVSMSRYAEQIRRLKPILLVSYPGPLEYFAEYCKNSGLRFPSIKAIITSAETLWPAQRQNIEEALGLKIYNRYGCREVGDIAHECSQHNGLHVNSDRVVVEIVDAAGQPSAPGEIGNVLVTDLDNYGMPFIRYEIGDRAAWDPGDTCTCGMPYPRLQVVEGRSLDVVVTPTGKRLGGTFWTILFRTRPGISKFRILQDNLAQLKIEYVPDQHFDDELLTFLSDHVRSACGSSMTLEFERVSSIPLTDSGKQRLVISSCARAETHARD